METCDETTAKFMAESLLNHAKDIFRYAKTFCEPTQANHQLDEEQQRKFGRTVRRMLNEMYSLMLMAKFKGISRFCNEEQIEAYMNEAKKAITSAVVEKNSIPQFN